jgi:DNA-binding MarR family transcriptional regulator
MGDALKRRIRQARFDNPVHEAILNVVVAANYIRECDDRVMESFGITLPQYNVLRILRGVHPDGHPRCDIAARMLDRAPDVTRLIDRLEEKKLVERDRSSRDRSSRDRRHSITKITRRGLQLLEQMDGPMNENIATFQSRLGVKDAKELSRLCEKIYEEVGGE